MPMPQSSPPFPFLSPAPRAAEQFYAPGGIDIGLLVYLFTHGSKANVYVCTHTHVPVILLNGLDSVFKGFFFISCIGSYKTNETP